VLLIVRHPVSLSTCTAQSEGDGMGAAEPLYPWPVCGGGLGASHVRMSTNVGCLIGLRRYISAPAALQPSTLNPDQPGPLLRIFSRSGPWALAAW